MTYFGSLKRNIDTIDSLEGTLSIKGGARIWDLGGPIKLKKKIGGAKTKKKIKNLMVK
jgi:hypothetical protein